MAITKAKRSVHLSKEARRNDRRAADRHSDRGGSSAERRNQTRSTSRSTRHSAKAKSKTRTKRRTQPRSSTPSPGDFALHERTLPHRRFIEFPLVKGKIAERVQLFTAGDDNSLTIDFHDQTSLVLDIEPGFTIHAQLMRLEKGELETLAEWPPIPNISDR